MAQRLFDDDGHLIGVDGAWPRLLAVIEVALELQQLLVEADRTDDAIAVELIAGAGVVREFTRSEASVERLLPLMGPATLQCARHGIAYHRNSRTREREVTARRPHDIGLCPRRTSPIHHEVVRTPRGRSRAMPARTHHHSDVHRRPHAAFSVIAAAALLAAIASACEDDESTTSPTESAATAAPTVAPTPAPTVASTAAPTVASTTAPTSTIGSAVSYPGGAVYVSGTIEGFGGGQGTVTVQDNGASQSRDGTISYTMVANDPRVSGTLTGTWNSDRWGVLEDGALVQWGDVVLTNDEGTWEGPFLGVYTSDYGGDVLTRWTVGTGAYEGLTFFFWLDTAAGSDSGPWYGLIYPGDPPPMLQLTAPSGG